MARKKIEPPKLGHVVRDYYIGNTHILVCDDSVRMTHEEGQALLDRIIDWSVGVRNYALNHDPEYREANRDLWDPDYKPEGEASCET